MPKVPLKVGRVVNCIPDLGVCVRRQACARAKLARGENLGRTSARPSTLGRPISTATRGRLLMSATAARRVDACYRQTPPFSPGRMDPQVSSSTASHTGHLHESDTVSIAYSRCSAPVQPKHWWRTRGCVSSRSASAATSYAPPAETGFLALAHLNATAAAIGHVPYDRPNERPYHAITIGTTGTWDGLRVRRLSTTPGSSPRNGARCSYTHPIWVQLPCSGLLMPCAVAVGPRTADRRVLRRGLGSSDGVMPGGARSAGGYRGGGDRRTVGPNCVIDWASC